MNLKMASAFLAAIMAATAASGGRASTPAPSRLVDRATVVVRVCHHPPSTPAAHRCPNSQIQIVQQESVKFKYKSKAKTDSNCETSLFYDDFIYYVSWAFVILVF
jgi:hypothetical protein